MQLLTERIKKGPAAVSRGRVVCRAEADGLGLEKVHPAHAATRGHRRHCWLRLRLLRQHRLDGNEQAAQSMRHPAARAARPWWDRGFPPLITSVNSLFGAS